MYILDMFKNKLNLPEPGNALPGRENPTDSGENHFVNGNSIHAPYPEGSEKIIFGLGCFWGAERIFWEVEGVYVTAVGYSGGLTPNPTYHEVCTGRTGHSEVALVVFDPAVISCQALLKLFWESHNPTQGMKQGNDVGTQYRSAIYVYEEGQKSAALASMEAYQQALNDAGATSSITTEVRDAPEFYFAEEYHQQYLAKNPDGYCGIRGTGVSCPMSPLEPSS